MQVDAILTADWHIRSTVPVCRKDDYLETMFSKIGWVSAIQKKYGCPIYHAGDLFHKWEPGSFILGKLINHMPDQFYTVPGNHDLPQHNIELLEKSGLTVLSEAEVITVLNNKNIKVDYDLTIGGIAYGNLDHLKSLSIKPDILICHEMIYQSPEHWQKENGSQALAFLKKHKGYQLIVTGHNHKPFTARHEGRLLVNPGSLMRMTADQKDYKPRVYLWNKESNTVKIEYVPIDSKAVETVYLEKTKERDERMESFIERLQSSKEVGLSYEKNIENYLANNRVRSSVKDVINECIGG